VSPIEWKVGTAAVAASLRIERRVTTDDAARTRARRGVLTPQGYGRAASCGRIESGDAPHNRRGGGDVDGLDQRGVVPGPGVGEPGAPVPGALPRPPGMVSPGSSLLGGVACEGALGSGERVSRWRAQAARETRDRARRMVEIRMPSA
jgi:hypothetical protein